ncbi:YhjD/YihY/BrkB family envelope integrity protein [Solidesulfovibrio sp.]|uniref:YhjD/YihY/BrkB family envelope integrity protein n=1 Tax=Solidesulfovibrio sp. TaxID=2910990 RepID=UPI002B1FDEF1|nr:YhjD/YihY/BrkB family envelope integrity protein [Solidesulfovibrio sp.]MEA5090634.1 YhjD/YihY/BrkB family envelope integrity protein [Solidesulfovibrio sp.]
MRIAFLTPGPRLRAVLETAAGATSGFLRSSGPAQAAALAFYALLSCIPLFFVMLVGYGLIAGESWSAQVLLRRQMATLAPFVDEILVARARKLLWASPGLSWTSVAFILWSSWLFVGALGRALALPWREARPGGRPLRQRMLAVLKGPFVGALFVAAMAAALYCAQLPRLEPVGSLARRLSPVWGVACLTGLFLVVYLLFLPRRPLKLLCALAAVLAGAVFCVSAAFTAAVAGLPRYHLVYGQLSGAILFLLWLDYNAWVLLWGAWFVRDWQKRQPPPERAPSGARIVVGPWLPGFRAARSAPKPRS